MRRAGTTETNPRSGAQVLQGPNQMNGSELDFDNHEGGGGEYEQDRDLETIPCAPWWADEPIPFKPCTPPEDAL